MPSTISVDGIAAGHRRQAPVATIALDPAGERPTTLQHRVEQRERRIGHVDHDLAGRHADAACPELGVECRVAVDEDMTRPGADAGRPGLGQGGRLVVTGHGTQMIVGGRQRENRAACRRAFPGITAFG